MSIPKSGTFGVLKMAVCTSVKSGGLVTVKIGSQLVTAQCPQDLSVSVKDPVVVGKVGNTYLILQRYFSAVGNVDPTSDGTSSEPPSAPCDIVGATTFVPRRTATYRDGKWRTDNSDIYQGELGNQGNNVGCAFYGGQIHAALAGATVLSASLKAKRLAGGKHSAQATTLVHITESAKPSGAPSTGGTYTGPNLSVDTTRTTIVVDTALAQAMVDGTYGGLGLHDSSGSPYVRLAGLSHYSGSFALTIHWQRGT